VCEQECNNSGANQVKAMAQFPNPSTQFKPGISGNPAGKPKGTKHIATWIQELLNDEEFEARILDSKIGLKEFKGAPLKAIIEVAITKAINGDKQWADWLANNGWKQQLDITSDNERLGVTLSAEQAEQLIRARANRSAL
jgi:hypothetical protein